MNGKSIVFDLLDIFKRFIQPTINFSTVYYRFAINFVVVDTQQYNLLTFF